MVNLAKSLEGAAREIDLEEIPFPTPTKQETEALESLTATIIGMMGKHDVTTRSKGAKAPHRAITHAVFIFGTTRILDREQWQNPCCALGGPARTLPLPDVPDFNLSQRWRPGLSASDAHSNATRTVAATMEGHGGPVWG